MREPTTILEAAFGYNKKVYELHLTLRIGRVLFHRAWIICRGRGLCSQATYIKRCVRAGLNISLRSQACTNTYTGEMYSHAGRSGAPLLCARTRMQRVARDEI